MNRNLGPLVLLLAVSLFAPACNQYCINRSPKTKTDISALMQSLVEYAINNNGAYPDTLEPLVIPDENGHCYLEGYNGRVPQDPWKREYQYELPTGGHPLPRVWTYGADGRPGGTGDDEDIYSDVICEDRE